MTDQAPLPYATNVDLPLPGRSQLPADAHDVLRAACNATWEKFADRRLKRRDSLALRAGWSEVKGQYRKRLHV